MTNLTTTHLKHLLDQAAPGPWTVEENKWDETIVANEIGHQMSWGEQVRFEFLAGNPKADPQLAAAAPQLAQEVIRLREQVKGLILAMETKAANNERQDPTTIASYLKEITLGDHDE